MEILVVTLAYMMTGHTTDGLARMRLVAETLHHAPGLMSVCFYRSRERNPSYLMLTTWEDEESWQGAQEHYNPKKLLLNSSPELPAAALEQWHMHYLWGYSRPAVIPTIAAAHLTSVHPYKAELNQEAWINKLRRQDMKLALGFAFLARGMREETIARRRSLSFNSTAGEENPLPFGSLFLNLFGWESEAACRTFYANPAYRELDSFVSNVGTMQVLFLEPL